MLPHYIMLLSCEGWVMTEERLLPDSTVRNTSFPEPLTAKSPYFILVHLYFMAVIDPRVNI